MTEISTKRENTCLKLDNPEDARILICDVLSEIRDGDTMAEHSGKICNLLQVWLKCWQIEQLSDIEKRLDALEQQSGLPVKKQ